MLAFRLSLFFVAVFSNNVIDVDDILSADFMPGNLLLLENPQQRSNEYKNLSDSNGDEETKGVNLDGSVNAALTTMGYHRSMMNEYLCRNFVAEQIVSEMSLSRIQKRLGSGMMHEADGNLPKKRKHVPSNNLLQDEGSSAYKNWLSKSTTLEDIYRHYEKPQNRDSDEEISVDDHDHEEEEDYSNHLVGYAYAQQPVAPSKLGYGDSGGGYYSGGGGGTSGGGGGYHYPSTGVAHTGTAGHSGHGGYSYSSYGGGYGTTGASGYTGGGHTSYGSPPKYHGGGGSVGKEHDLADLFDIAVTALAYLSFGMFIVHVIMCISMTNNQGTTTTSMMPMSMSPTAVEPTGMTSTGGSTGGTGDGGDSGGSDSGDNTGDGGGETTQTGSDGGESTGGDGENNEGGGSDTTGDEGGGTGGSTGGGEGGTGGDGGDAEGGTGEGGDGGNDMETENGAPGSETGGTGTDNGGDMGTSTGMDTDSGSTTSTGDGGDGDGGDTAGATADESRDQINIRLRRDIPTITQPDNVALNELARKILTSIEAAFVAMQDDGECLKKSLCENNKYSRTMQGSNKIWIPVWSLGMSWLSGKLVQAAPLSVSTLDSIKASILGLGNANCDIIYQRCDLLRVRKSRRRRRRRRRNT